MQPPLTRRAFVAGLPLSLTACVSTSRRLPEPPPVDPAYMAMYAALPDEPFPVPAVDASQVEPHYLRQVVAFDGQDHTLRPDAEVVIAGDTIRHVGHGWAQPVEVTHDCGEAVLAPGFVDLNALGDVDCTILTVDVPDASRGGLIWSRRYAEAGARDVLGEDDRVEGARSALAQLLLGGITTGLPVTNARLGDP